MAKKNVAGTTADPVVKFATLKVDGTEYKLVYDFNAIAEAEALTGLNLLTGMINLWQDLTATKLMGASIVRGLLYAALRPKLDLEAVGHMIRVDTLTDIVAAIREAYAESMPVPEKNEHAADTAA